MLPADLHDLLGQRDGIPREPLALLLGQDWSFANNPEENGPDSKDPTMKLPHVGRERQISEAILGASGSFGRDEQRGLLRGLANPGRWLR